MDVESQTSQNTRPVWKPVVISIGTLFGLFASAMAIRHSPLADSVRPVMIALSTAAAVIISIYGVIMMTQARARGIASAVAGLIMLVLGLYTANHVLR